MRDKLIAAINEYVKAYEAKYGVSLIKWLDNDIGGIALIGDFYMRFDDIRKDVEGL